MDTGLAEIHVKWSMTVTVRSGPKILFALEMKCIVYI